MYGQLVLIFDKNFEFLICGTIEIKESSELLA